MNPNHRDKQAARRRRGETGQSYASALADIRQEHRTRLDVAQQCLPEPKHDGVPVPDVLLDLVRYHSCSIGSHLNEALDNGHFFAGDFAEWMRLTLYTLSDGLERHFLLVGAIAAFLRNEGVPNALLRRFLRVRTDSEMEVFMAPRVLEHVAGLRNEPMGDDGSRSAAWHFVGERLAAGENRTEGRYDDLEVFLGALFTGYPEDALALDHLPQRLRDRILALLPHRSPDPDTGAS